MKLRSLGSLLVLGSAIALGGCETDDDTKADAAGGSDASGGGSDASGSGSDAPASGSDASGADAGAKDGEAPWPDGGWPDGSTQSAPTYWADVAPIFNAKCVKCHQPGGIGPFNLSSYDMAKGMATKIAINTRQRIMPPYLVTHDGTCGSFEDAEALTDAEIDVIGRWATGDKLEGTPATLVTPKTPALQGDGIKEFKTPELMPIAGGPSKPYAVYDEYRCFPIATNQEKDLQFITGYEVKPGNDQIVHHVVSFLIDPDKVGRTGKKNSEVIQALDDGPNGDDKARVGWPCFGLAGEGVAIDAVPTVWAPGQGPVQYPTGIGVPQKKNHLLVVQLHYNLADPKSPGMKDSTTVRFAYADKVNRVGIFALSDGFLDTLGRASSGGIPDFLPPGKDSAVYTWKKSMTQLGTELGLAQVPPLDLVAVMPHMHARGHKKKIELLNSGTSSCQAQVDRWDFAWQKFYFYKAMPHLMPTTEIQLTCDYDTSADKAPVLPGWGTYNEMCIAILMLALPPGVGP